jgi:hypothetical protein
MDEYRFGNSSFKKLLWIKGGATFENPSGIDVEFVSPGAFTLRVAYPSGAVRKDHTYQNANGGWNSCDMTSLGIHSGAYKLGFVNASPGEKRIKQGVVYVRD